MSHGVGLCQAVCPTAEDDWRAPSDEHTPCTTLRICKLFPGVPPRPCIRARPPSLRTTMMTSSSRVLAFMLLAAAPCWLAFVWNSRASAEAPVGGARGCASRDDRALTISVPSRQKDIPSAGPATDDTSIDAAFQKQRDPVFQSLCRAPLRLVCRPSEN